MVKQKEVTITCPHCGWKGTATQYLQHYDKCQKRLFDKKEKKPVLNMPEVSLTHNEFVHKQLKKILDEEKAERQAIEKANIQETHAEEPEITTEPVAEAPIEEPSPEGTWLIRNEILVEVEGKVEEPSENVIETIEDTPVEEVSKPSEEELVFENRAWEKAEHSSYVSETLERGDSEFIFEISYHYPRKQYYVDVSETKDFGKGFRETYAKMEFFADTLDDCFKWIEENYNVKTVHKT